jgi:hypothetical protein
VQLERTAGNGEGNRSEERGWRLVGMRKDPSGIDYYKSFGNRSDPS